MKINYQTTKTPTMRQFFTLTLLVLAFTSCRKSDVQEPLDPNKQYTIKFDLTDQIAQTRVGNDTLYLDFTQKINLLTDPSEYGHSWALYLSQDFSKSFLNNLHYSALAKSNIWANDWVTLNLNELHPTQISATNVTVDNRKYVRVTITRLFKFYSVLANQQAAIDKQNALIQTNTETVTYSSYYSYNDVFSLPNVNTSKIVYTR